MEISLACSHSDKINSEMWISQISRRTPWTGDQSSRKAATYTGKWKHTINVDMHAASRIRTHELSVWATEDLSCFRERGHFFLISWGGERCDWVHLVRRPLIGLLYKLRMIDDYGTFDRMRIGRGNWNIRRKAAPLPLRSPKPHIT
jgi:hypothetical protein